MTKVKEFSDYEKLLNVSLTKAGIKCSCRQVIKKSYTFGTSNQGLVSLVGTIESVTISKKGDLELVVSKAHFNYEPVRYLTYIKEGSDKKHKWKLVLKTDIHSSPRYVEADEFKVHIKEKKKKIKGL